MNQLSNYDNDLRTLYELAYAIGRRAPFWVQGAGGNVSVKVAKTEANPALLFIKASGCRLDQMSAGKSEGLSVGLSTSVAAVDLEKFNAQFGSLETTPEGEQQYAQLLQDTRHLSLSQSKPSMETGFHALLPQKYVLHFHSLAAIEMAAPHNRDLVEKVFSQLKISYKFVELCQPGLELTQKILVDPNCTIYLLASHGVVIQGDDAGVLKLWEKLEQLQLASAQSELFDFANADFAAVVAKLFASEKKINFQWQCLFPDAAVFSQKIRALLPKATIEESDFAKYQNLIDLENPEPGLSHEAAIANRNYLEIVLATLILQRLAVPVPEMSPEYCAGITGLPTEKFRQEFRQGAQ